MLFHLVEITPDYSYNTVGDQIAVKWAYVIKIWLEQKTQVNAVGKF